MKLGRLALACILLLDFVFPPAVWAEDLPYSLVDKDQYSIFEEEQAAKREAALTLEDPPDDADLLRYSNEFWRQAVTSVEGAYELDKGPEPIPDLTLLNPTLSLPLYGTSIALTGRYVLGLKIASTKYKTDTHSTVSNRDDRTVEMNQQIQLKMQGKILDRVFVDIDYDDQREEEKTISVAYRGKPGELVQLAEFGDINLSLPGTEFITYSKELFGAKMHLQHKNANLYLIGSQTKGSSKQKQFIGSSVSEIVSLADTSYKRRVYYDLTFGGNVRPSIKDDGTIIPSIDPSSYDDWRVRIGQIATGTEEIYLDSNSTSSDYVPVYKTASDYLEGGSYEAKWQLLTRGVDYVIDYASGIIEFRRTISAASVLAVDYVGTNGTRLSSLGTPNTIKLIKTANDTPITPSPKETANKLELKTYYSIGAQKITQDNGKGNFILQLLDANGQSLSSPYHQYPTYINVDFDKGIFDLTYRIYDSGLYGSTPTSSRNLTFKIQYESTVKTYFIEAGIVVQSETVTINGRKLVRNNDYYIDYTSGFITFYKGELITDNSVIDISYDTTGGDSANNSVIGGRLDYKLFDKILLGTTAIQEGGEKPSTVPQVGQYSKELLVYGADINGRDIKLADPLSVDFGVEAAHSVKRQNLFGYAMVDNMNSASEQVAGSRIFNEWQIASNPNDKPNFLNAIHWDTEELPALEINPNSVANYNDKQQVLTIDYDFTQGVDWDGRDEVSIVYPLSKSGVDLSEKTSFELTLLGEENGPFVNFTFGNINEDSDGSGGMNTQCGTGVPKTEDVSCRNTLAPNEDIGWLYQNPDGSQERYNPFVHNRFNPESQPNGRIDTQDLNGNGKFDKENIPSNGNFGFQGTPIDGLPGNQATNTTWQTYSMAFTPQNKEDWTAVRHLRITLKKGGKLKGQIKIATVALAGTAWKSNIEDASKFSLSGINNVDNRNYEPIFNDKRGDGQRVFNYLYGSIQNYKDVTDSANALDQSLRIKFDTSGTNCDGEVCYANRNFSSMDFSQHREFRFLLHGEGINKAENGNEFFLKVGTSTNYDKIIVPTGFDGWRLISVKMVDSNGDGIPDTFTNVSEASYNVRVESHRVQNGLLNFREISLILAGMQTAQGTTGGEGEVWLNVIHLADAIILEGDAYKGDVTVRLDEWGSAGARYVHKDSDFETPLTVSKQQKTTEEDYFLKVDRVKDFPMEAHLSRSSVTTPLITDSTNYNTVNLLDKGEVKRQRASVQGELKKEKYPHIGLSYAQDETEYQLMKRQDHTRTYGVTLTHTTGAFKNITAGYHYTDEDIEYDGSRHLESATYYDTQENTQKMNMKVTYQPSNNFQFTPSYNLSKSKEDRTHFSQGSRKDLRYPKALTQNTGFNSTWKITKWLAPSVNYNISTVENNNLSEKRSANGKHTFDIGQVKTVNRNGDGGISLTLNGNELLPKSKLFNTFVIASSYRLQDADSWADVDSGFDSRKALWIRSSMKDVGEFGYRRNLTLRDTFTSTQRWNPFSQYNLAGAFAPLKTLSLINNFSHTVQNNEQTGTTYDSKSRTLPDMTISISELEKFFYAGRWLSSTNLKLRYSFVEQTNINTDNKQTKQYGGDLRFMLFNYFDTVLNYTRQESNRDDLRAHKSLERVLDNNTSAQTSFYVGAMRITPKVLFNAHDKWLAMGQVSESSRAWEPSLNLRWDFNIPRGFKLPLIHKIYKTSNRVIWNTTFTYKHQKSPVEVKENYQLFDALTSLDYEFSQNLRFTLSGGLTMLQHAYVKTEDYTSYNVAANLTVQF